MSEVILREVLESDLPIFYQHQLEPEATQMAAFPSRAWEDFEKHWKKNLANTTSLHRTILFEGQVVGNVVSWEQMGEREVGYWIGKEFWDRGIATKALEQFVQLLPHPLFAHVVEHNRGSIRVLAKCGFEIVGEERGEDGLEEFIFRLDN